MIMGKGMRNVLHIVMYLVLFVIIALFVGDKYLPAEGSIIDGKYEEFDVAWYQLMDDGSKVAVDIPGRVENTPGEWTSIVCTIPELPDSRHAILTRSSQQDMYIYVDDELRKCYSTEETRPWGKSTMSANVVAQLNKEDSGKELKITIKSITSYSGLYNTIYFGTELELYDYLIEKNIAGVIVAYTLLFSGVLAFIIGIFLRIKYKTSFPMIYAALEAIIVSMQAILESRLRQFIFSNISLAGFLSYVLIGLIPVITILYINVIQKSRYEKMYFVMTVVCLANVFINIGLQFFDIQDMYASLGRTYFLFVFSFVLILGTFVKDYKAGILKEIKYPVIGVVLTFIMAFGEILITLFKLITITGLFINIGMASLLVAAIVESFKQVDAINMERQKAISDSIAKQNFLANMSHEIRTPINAILGMNEMILRECKDEAVLQYASNIRAAGDNLLDIINDILDFSKIELGKLEIVPAEYSLNSLMRDVRNIIAIRAEGKNLAFDIVIHEGLPAKLIGDEYRLRQILLNLLNNAVKYTDKGSVKLIVGGNKMDELGRFMLKIDVEDTGKGIKAEDLPKIFEHFERIDLEHNKNIEGTGLGLAITHTIVDMMKGEIGVESTYGRGTRFTVTIPQEIITDEVFDETIFRKGIEKVSANNYKETFKAPDAKILLVDDYPINITVIKGLLKKTQVQISEATSGKACIDMCAKERYDLILMDHMMPEMDGVETFEKLRELHENLCPVIILTANALEGAKEEYLEQGFADYISKPVDPVELERVIKEYIKKRS